MISGAVLLLEDPAILVEGQKPHLRADIGAEMRHPVKGADETDIGAGAHMLALAGAGLVALRVRRAP